MELIILSAILVASVVIHFILWRDSKKRYSEYMKQVDSLKAKMTQLEANDKTIDKMIDKAEEDEQAIKDEIESLRSVWFMKKKKELPFDN